MTDENRKTEAETETDAVDEARSGDNPDAGQAGAEETGKSADQLEAELDDLRDRLLRAVADAENTRKRAQREIKDTRDYAITGFARDMLDIADNLTRAVNAVPAEARESAPDSVKTLIEGVEMTERRLHSALERHGVRKIEPAPGDPLDPNRHQAAAQVPADQPKGRIAHVMQPGYVIGERTLRAAMVVVSAGPAEGQGEGQDKRQYKGSEGDGGGVDVSA